MAKDVDEGAAGVAAELAASTARARGRTLGDAAGSLGHPIRDIEGETVDVIGLEFPGTRDVRAQGDNPEKGIKKGDLIPMEVCIITVEGSDASGRGIRYFTLSPSLVDKLRGVDPAELPLPARFVTRDIGGGQRVWDVE